MKIGVINFFTQKNPLGSARIIDTHVHTGDFNGKSYTAENLDIFVKNPLTVDVCGKKEKDRIEKMFVSNLSSIAGMDGKDEIEGNEEMLQICRQNPKFEPVAVCEPHRTKGDTTAIRKVLEENEGEFKGLKFHPTAFNLKACDPSYDPYLDLAEEKGLPCLFHSEVNILWQCDENGKYFPTEVKEKENWSPSDPEFIYELAKRHPKVPVILGHTGAGGPMAHKKAIDVLNQSIENKDANLYCDISWIDFDNGIPSKDSKSLINLIETLKEKDALDRIMFGTDAPLGCFGECIRDDFKPTEAYAETIGQFKTQIIDHFGKKEGKKIVQQIFYDNAKKLFNEK